MAVFVSYGGAEQTASLVRPEPRAVYAGVNLSINVCFVHLYYLLFIQIKG